MSGYSSRALILVSAALFAGCIDPETAPTAPQPSASEIDAVTSLRLATHSLTLQEGEEFQLDAALRNQRGQPILSRASVTYSTTQPSVATVGMEGFVKAHAPGTAVIRATASVGMSLFIDSTVVVVVAAHAVDSVELAALTNGWSPRVAHIVSGGIVKWLGGLIATSGVPVEKVYLYKEDITRDDIDDIDLRSGSATRRLSEPGTYYYCSNACWDAPEWGTIIVH